MVGSSVGFVVGYVEGYLVGSTVGSLVGALVSNRQLSISIIEGKYEFMTKDRSYSTYQMAEA